MAHEESPEMCAALVQAAAILVATGHYSSQDAVDCVLVLRALLRQDGRRFQSLLPEQPF